MKLHKQKWCSWLAVWGGLSWGGLSVLTAGPLEERVPHFSVSGVPLEQALHAIGRAQGLSVIVDRDVAGEVSLEANGLTVKGVIEALLAPYGFSYTADGSLLHVHRFESHIYEIDYPQMSRSGSATSSISMGATGSSGASQLQGMSMPFLESSSGQRSDHRDSTQIQIEQKADADFWEPIEAQLRTLLMPEEQLVLNRFSGLLHVKAGRPSQRQIEEFVGRLNERIGAQVEILAKIVEVSLSDEKKLGIDWQSAAISIGGDTSIGSPVQLPNEATAVAGVAGLTNLLRAGDFQFSPDSLTGTFTSGKVDVVIRALQQQGEVQVTSQPRLRLLNNQTGFIKDATDRPFFRLTSNVTINAGGSAQGGSQPITQSQYTTETISIGTVLPVTAQISRDGEITLDVTPALTRLRDVVTSPDRQQTAPVLEVKQTSTVIRLRSGETGIIGGLITEGSGRTQRAVPGLGKIPGLGRLFRSEGKSTSRTELVILLTPTLVGRRVGATQGEAL